MTVLTHRDDRQPVELQARSQPTVAVFYDWLCPVCGKISMTNRRPPPKVIRCFSCETEYNTKALEVEEEETPEVLLRVANQNIQEQ